MSTKTFVETKEENQKIFFLVRRKAVKITPKIFKVKLFATHQKYLHIPL